MMWMNATKVRDNRVVLTAVLLGLVLLAWFSLFVWSLSPYARFLDHKMLANHSLTAPGDYLLVLVLFVGSWTLMTIAMMLPTSLPLIGLFRGLVQRRPHRRRLVGLLLVGYLAVWIAFGMLAHVGDWALHDLVNRNLWLALHPQAIAVAIFLLAGLYQFTPFKYYCLEKCRSPLSFIMGHWHGRNEQREALALGFHHGLFCLGCCWSLMLLMFAVGMGNLGWMLALGVVMAVEKNLPWGRRLGKPLGALLIAWAVVIALAPGPQW